jgi:hypothetical protein
MRETQIRFTASIIAWILGLSVALVGLQFNLSHFDVGPDSGASFFTINQVSIGLVTLALAPLISKKYTWFGIQLGVALALFVWIYLF